MGFIDWMAKRRGYVKPTGEAKMPLSPEPIPAGKELPNPENDLVNFLDQLDSGKWSSSELERVTQLAERRDQRYTVYDQMRQNDSLAAAVLEIYADDITQLDPQGRSIWAEADDANIADAANRLIRVLGIDDDLWSTAYCLVCYGDVYFKLFRDEKKGTLYNEATIKVHEKPKRFVLEEYVERLPDPSEVFDLTSKGNTVAYLVTHVNENKQDEDGWNKFYNNWAYKLNTNDVDVYDSHSYVHIYVPDAGVRHPYKFVLTESTDPEDKKKTNSDLATSLLGSEFTVSTGKSLLQDAYKVSQQLQLMENALLLSRLTRASIYRLIQVNVGKKSETEVVSLLNRIKALFDKKQTIDANAGTMTSYNNPGPEVSNIVVPVQDNNQGAISTSTIGGDYDPKSLSDLDYWINKELGTFKVPRQYLNFTDGGGFNGGSSLAKISAQYAHRLIRYKKAIIKGVTTLINLFFDNRKPDYVGKFEVKMTQTTTVEDAERVQTAKDKLDMIGNIMDQLDKMEDPVGKFEILKDAFEDAYPNSTVSRVLDDYIKKLKNGMNPESTDGDGSGSDLGGGGGGSFSSGGSSSPVDDLLGSDNEGGDTTSDDTASDDTSGDGSEFPTDLSDEGVDYTDDDAVNALLGDEK